MTTRTRRDLIKLASALGLAGTVPTVADRIAAAQILDQEVSSRAILDPATFSRETHLTMGNDTEGFGNDWYGVIDPVANTEYVKAREQLYRVLSDHGIDSFHACGDFDAAFFAFVLSSYDAGLRHGSAYEHLRRSLVGDVVQCTTCWGAGAPRDKKGNVIDNALCKTCGGTGTVALREG